MRTISLFASLLMLAAGSAVAQTDKDKQPGGNVPLAQGPCSAGFENSVKNGKMARLSDENMRAVDTNKDGNISRSEFDAACANKLFKEQDSKG
jgi:hypothetical protein